MPDGRFCRKVAGFGSDFLLVVRRGSTGRWGGGLSGIWVWTTAVLVGLCCRGTAPCLRVTSGVAGCGRFTFACQWSIGILGCLVSRRVFPTQQRCLRALLTCCARIAEGQIYRDCRAASIFCGLCLKVCMYKPPEKRLWNSSLYTKDLMWLTCMYGYALDASFPPEYALPR